MRIAHWTMGNGSGMHRVAESMVQGEKALGMDAVLINLDHGAEYAQADDADIHVSHTHLPNIYDRVQKGQKVVWVGHGVPEHVFQSAVESGLKGGYGHGDAWMLMQYWLQHSDAVVTFWPRHAEFYRSMSDKRSIVDCIPLGVDLDFWKPGQSNGKFRGNPSVFTAENSHYIKWPLDLFIAWGYLSPKVPEATLHAIYLPKDQHRWFFPLINRNGVSYSGYISAQTFDHPGMLNAFRSVDYYVGLVKYGDFNRVCLEAKASGCKVISYKGNPYADFWIDEGDQRVIAEQLEAVITGKVEPRVPEVPSPLAAMSSEMIKIYERVLA